MKKNNKSKKIKNRGQGMSEYILLISAFGIVMLGVMAAFVYGVSDLYLNILRIIVLPLP